MREPLTEALKQEGFPACGSSGLRSGEDGPRAEKAQDRWLGLPGKAGARDVTWALVMVFRPGSSPNFSGC